jgi:hypothetical protein
MRHLPSLLVLALLAGLLLLLPAGAKREEDARCG